MPDQPSLVHGWAFLVARGRRKGYQSLLAPDFLAESDEYGILGQAASGDVPAEGPPQIIQLTGLAAGDVTLAYQTQRLTSADREGSAAAGTVTDDFGRPLDLLYGFVCRAAGISEIRQVDLATARAEALRTYRRFLADESGFSMEASRSFVLRSVTASQPVLEPAARGGIPSTNPVSEPPPAAVHHGSARRTSPLGPVLAAGLIMAVSAIVWLGLLRGDTGPVTKVVLADLASSTVDCTGPLMFSATVATDSPATITYHWDSSLDGASTPSQTLLLGQAGTATVGTTVRLSGATGTKFDLTQTLVIDEPNRLRDTRKYSLTCR